MSENLLNDDQETPNIDFGFNDTETPDIDFSNIDKETPNLNTSADADVDIDDLDEPDQYVEPSEDNADIDDETNTGKSY